MFSREKASGSDPEKEKGSHIHNVILRHVKHFDFAEFDNLIGEFVHINRREVHLSVRIEVR